MKFTYNQKLIAHILTTNNHMIKNGINTSKP